MTDTPWQHLWPLRSLPPRRALEFDLAPDAATRARIAADLGLLDLPALRLRGRLSATRDEVVLEARLTAQVVQPCSVTLVPVTTAIDEPLRRRFVADWQEPAGDEVELPEDVDVEPLPPAAIDGGAVAVEALALALPAWPRAPGADLGEAVFAPPGVAPLTDRDLRPFAGLAALKSRLEGEGG